jgi:hypothetical protein
LSIAEKVALDDYYLQHRSLTLDARIMLHTFLKAIRGDDVVNTGPRSTTASARAMTDLSATDDTPQRSSAA